MTIESTPNKDGKPTLRSSEYVIYQRMLWLDRQQGCHAALDTIRRAKDSGPTYSLSHARRIVARLRQRGVILFAGATNIGCNIYLHHDRSYEASKLPICSTRPIHHLWPTDGAEKLIKAALPRAKSFYVDGYPVSQKIAADYREDLIKEAVAAIHKSYAGRMHQIINRGALLRDICQKLLDSHDKHAAARRSEATKQATQQRWDGMPEEAKEALDKLLGRHSSPAASPPAPQPPAAVPAGTARQGTPERPAAAPREESQAEGPAPRTVSEWLTMWLYSRGPQIKDSTRSYYSGKLANVRGFLGDKELGALNRQIFLAYVEARRRDKVKEQTISAELGALATALREAELHGYCGPQIRKALPTLKKRNERQPRPLKHTEYEALRSQLTPHRQAYLDLGVYTGARKSELEGLLLGDVDFDRGRLHIRGTKTEGADRYVPLRPELAELLAKHPGGPLVGIWKNSNRDIALACEAAGIERRSVLDLRHTFASWLKREGVDSFIVARLMGHRNSKMVESVYAHLDDASLRAAMARMPARASPHESRPPPTTAPEP